jgi:hydrogenase small subunit
MEKKRGLSEELERRGISRRELLKYLSATAAFLGVPGAVRKLYAGVARPGKPVLVWLEFQDCAGNTESFLRASRPTVAEILLETISVNYHETIMAAAGKRATQALDATVRDKAHPYIAVVEGAIPTGADGAYCTIGGRAAIDIAREVCGNAAATIAVGSCAAFGGIPAAAPNPTSALSVADAVPGAHDLINLSACPANVENLSALLVYYLSFKRWPPLDHYRRPLFAYDKLIHDNCERRAHYDAGQYVEEWGDEGHRSGYCLFKMGCKGPVTSQNCPNVRWNEGTNWPIGCGHPCIGCAEPDFWDKMTPFYAHLPPLPGFGVASNVDKVGIVATAGVAAAFAAHGLVQITKRRLEQKNDDGAGPPPLGPGPKARVGRDDGAAEGPARGEK